ncbi:MAG: hypothetical protein KY397_01760 [Gemmatimonadetes bacterium]|nr:hypothetical protein [Gemmatimonadota bacterium]
MNRFDRRTLFALAGAASLALAALPSPASAQEIVRPRAPRLELRPAPLPEELARMPADTLLGFSPLRFDPWTASVRRARPFEEPGPERIPTVSALDWRAWLEVREAERTSRLHARAWIEALRPQPKEEQGLVPELENPLQIPEPLAKVFGEGSDFDIQGKLHLGAVGSRSRQDPDLRSQLLRRTIGGFDLDLDQILDLNVSGTVGTKLDVAVDFNSSRELDSKQLITAAYTGTEDEILKKVEVGDIRVSLPPSRFLGSSVGRGTFGARAIAQLGPVDLRVLGSSKEGQSTQRSLSISPGGEGILQEVVLDIKDTQFQDDRFFLLFHPDSLAGGRLAYPNSGTRLSNPASTPEPGSLNVWLDDGNFTNNRETAAKPGQAFVNPTAPATRPEETYQGFFDLLVEGEDYVMTDGVVLQMKRQVGDAEVLAVSYVTQDGTQVGSGQGANELELKLIKPINPDTVDFTWDYTLRNVYSLREPDIQLSSLSLTIYRGNRDLQQTFEIIDGESRKYTEIFGIGDPSGRIKVPRILRDPFGGADYLVFPDVRPFFRPTTEAGQPIELEVPNRRLYFNSDPRRTALDDQVYFIGASYLSRGGLTGEVELGATNILEGSETITIGGQPLQRGEDYQIFYDFGRLVFNDPAGLAERYPDAAVRIDFEVAPLFNLAPTSLWGATGTWNFSPDAVVNSTLLVQNEESLANRPILGAEPTRTLIGEVDATWRKETPFLTRWLDALPGLETEETSLLSMRGELAFSQPNPNTDGEVFLNDFENIQIAKRVGLFFRGWRHSSIPQGTSFGLTDLARLRWFTFGRSSSEITPGVRGVDRGEDVFTVLIEPAGETPTGRLGSWRSIQTVLSTSGEDLTRQEFVEFFVRGDRGTILFDLGTIDEDQVRVDRTGAPVGFGTLETEETNPDTRDNNLDAREDTGLDGVAGIDALGVPGDVGNDDFDDSFGDNFPRNPNGTENNNVLDTEDLNLNGLLDRQENVLRWVVDLADPRHEVAGSRTTSGFRKIRLPLVSPDERIGSADLRNVRAIRMTFTGLERRTELEIARLEIVGSTFLKRGIVDAQGTPIAGADTDSLRISAVNDVENPDYRSPPGVVAQQERANEIAGLGGIVREQSLELGFTGLPSGARASIYRPLFDRESYIDYGRMSVWVQGRDLEADGAPRFFVAFGIDTLNVYEYAAPLREGEWDEHLIDFGVFTDLKQELLDRLGAADTGSIVSEDGLYRVRIRSQTSPPPTLTDVGQLTIGVENEAVGSASGRFWIDEWRLTDPVREGGLASYVDARATLADFADVSITWESRGSRYRNLNAAPNNFDSGRFDMSSTFRLGKILPEAWGIAMPLTWDHYGRSDAPLFRVGSDIELKEGDPLRDAMTRSNDRDIMTLRAFRTRQSSNPLIGATLDRLEARITYRGEVFESFDLDTDRGRLDAWLGYRHGFRERTLPLPLDWIAKLPWPGAIKRSGALQKLSSADFNVAPSNVVLSTQTVLEEREAEKRLAEEGREFTADSTRTLQGTANIAFQPVRSMRLSMGMDNTRDLNFPETVIERGALGVDALRTHSLDFDWSPPVAQWLTPRWSYTSRFTRNHTREASRSLDSLDLRDFSVTTNQNLTLALAVPQLVEAISGGEEAARDVWWKRAFEPIRFDRTRQQSASYVQEEDDPGLDFIFGFGDLSEAASGEPQNRSEIEGQGVQGGLQLWRGLRVRAAYRETDQNRRYFAGTNETTTRTWPDVEVRWPNLRPPGVFQRVLAAVTLSSDFELRETENRSNGQPLDESERAVWDPLLAVTFTWRNGMTTDLRANTSTTTVTKIRGGVVDSEREEVTSDLQLNLNYAIQPGTKLWIPFPTLWGLELERPLRTSLMVARRLREDETRLAGEALTEGALNLKTLTTEVRPSASYEFGRIISGFAFSYLSRKDEKRDITHTTTSLEAYLDFLF